MRRAMLCTTRQQVAKVASGRRLGQHFLRREEDALDIVAAFAPGRQQRVVEIGPGRGALTRPLLAGLDRLDAIERDARLAAALVLPGLCMHHADAVRYDYRRLVAERGGALRVIGNLPYSITTPLLFHLLGAAEVITDMLFLVQSEVAARAKAVPGSSEYGRLSVMLQRRCTVQTLLTLPPAAFEPPPQVHATLVRFVPLPPPPDDALYAEVVRRAFSGRRKTLRNALAGLVAPAHIAAAGLDASQRPEQLSPADYARLTAIIGGTGSGTS